MNRAVAKVLAAGDRTEHRRLIALFPSNPYIRRLLNKAEEMGITLATSPVQGQWLYHPGDRILYVWEPDLPRESLSFLVVILAHELGHAIDFDTNPRHLRLIHNRHWSEAPVEVEIAAFVNGFRILKDLFIPVSLEEYEHMIAPPIAHIVRNTIEAFHLCCLLCHETTPTNKDVCAAM